MFLSILIRVGKGIVRLIIYVFIAIVFILFDIFLAGKVADRFGETYGIAAGTAFVLIFFRVAILRAEPPDFTKIQKLPDPDQTTKKIH